MNTAQQPQHHRPRSSGAPTMGALVALALYQPPDPVDVGKVLALSRRERVPPGEWALRVAILDDAIGLLRKHADRIRHPDPDDQHTAWRQDYAEAYRWVCSTDRGQPFAFAAVCDVLGLDPQAAREAILRDVPAVSIPASPPPARRSTEPLALPERCPTPTPGEARP